MAVIVLSLGALSRRYGVPVLANPATLEAIAGPLGQVYALPMATGSTHSLGEVDVASFPIPHDAADPVGYLLECDGWRIAVAVDVGIASAVLLEPLPAQAPGTVRLHLRPPERTLLGSGCPVDLVDRGRR